jgi:hypothetical protein
MSDQNVITDWPAYFKALGPGKPFTPEEIARMCALTKHTCVLVINEDNLGLMGHQEIEAERCMDIALSAWEGYGKCEMWLFTEWPCGAPVYIPAAPKEVKKRGPGR